VSADQIRARAASSAAMTGIERRRGSDSNSCYSPLIAAVRTRLEARYGWRRGRPRSGFGSNLMWLVVLVEGDGRMLGEPDGGYGSVVVSVALLRGRGWPDWCPLALAERSAAGPAMNIVRCVWSRKGVPGSKRSGELGTPFLDASGRAKSRERAGSSAASWLCGSYPASQPDTLVEVSRYRPEDPL
jgi:hypothetical protein